MLAARARSASDGRLAIDVLAGAVVVAASLVWRGPAWHLVAAIAAGILAFGAWGIADRELRERAGRAAPATLRALRAARVAAVVLGAVAALTVLATGLGIALGRMIS